MPTSDVKLFGPSGLLFDEDTWGPELVSGPDKVAQRFLYYLMLPVGTVPGRPSDGCGFAAELESFRSEFDLYAAFSTAEPAVSRCVRNCEADDDPAGDKYGAAALVAVVFAQAELTLTFAVRAADGTSPADPVDLVIEL